MAKFNTYYPFTPTDYAFTARTIQTSGATSGFAWVFICPANFASGATFEINMSVSSNGNSGGQAVSARLYALTTGGNWDSAAPLSAIATLSNSTANFPASGVADMTLTLTSALTKGVRYALRIFPDTTFTAGLGINAIFSTINPYIGNVDEYHIQGTTISTGVPNFAIGDGTTFIGNRCTRRLPQTTPATTAVASQVGFRFTLPSTNNYTLNEVVIKGLVLSNAIQTTGTFIGRILDNAGTTTLASSIAVTHGSCRVASNVAGNYTFSFTTNPTLTGSTGYIFVVENSFEKTLQYFEVQNATDSAQTFNGEVIGIDVVYRNGTSGAFTSQTGLTGYQAMPFAHIDAVPVAGVSSGLAANPLAGYVR